MRIGAICASLCAALSLAGCQPNGATGDPSDAAVTSFDAIADDETIYFGGTEPFWGGEIAGGTLSYTTPENLDGETISVDRFTGLGGLSFAGTLAGQSFDLLVTEGACSDGMSDRIYPYAVTLQLGDEQRSGCAHTDKQKYEEQAAS